MSIPAGRTSYRKLMRTAKYVFKGDKFAITQARITLREEFFKNKNVTDSSKLAELFRGVEEVDEMLRFNIVQGKLNERGNYGLLNRFLLTRIRLQVFDHLL